MTVVSFSFRQILVWMTIVGCLLASFQILLWPRTGLLDAAVYGAMERSGHLRYVRNSEGEDVLGAPDSKGLLDAAAFAILACALTWWLHRQQLSRLRAASGWLWTTSLLSYGLADSFLIVLVVRHDQLGWNGFGWLLACVLAAAVGTIMALGWFIQTLFVRLGAAESLEFSLKGWIAQASAILCLGVPCVLIGLALLFLARSINPTH